MLVLHGFWAHEQNLCLWGEDSERTVKSPSQALRSARPHPFAARADLLPDIDTGGRSTEATLLLPSLRSAPLDSPELVRVSPRQSARTKPSLLPWTVPIVTFGASDALISLAAPAGLTPGTGTAESPKQYRLGASIRYLTELAAFARELVERGRVVPAIRHDDLGYIARWRPVLLGPDIITLHALVIAMPPICHAAPGLGGANEVATAALETLVDAAMRNALPDDLDLLPTRRGRPPKQPAVTEAWLAALSSHSGRFDAQTADADALARSLQAWEGMGTGQTGPARAMFRFTDDASDSGDDDTDDLPNRMWRLEFLLQSNADPSLMVPAEQAWANQGSLDRWLPRPQELLLAELGRASRIYPELVPALRQPRPSVLDLDADGAYTFLSVAAPKLDEAGFGILLPSWWDRRRKLGFTISAHTPVDGVVGGTSRFGREQLMEFSWRLAIGDDILTDDEIATLAEAKTPLIRLRGTWVAVDPEQLRRGLQFLEDTPTGTKSAGEILALAARDPDDGDTPLPLTGVSADGWLGGLLDGTASQSLQEVPLPDGFTAELRPYQRRGLSWLAFLSSLGLGACLADDMGLGKTVQLLALEALLRADGSSQAPTLLLCPMSLVGNWQREAARFAPALRVHAYHGRDRLRGQALREQLAESDIVLTTYATATRDIDELARLEWQRVVLDEAQAIKNALSQSAKAVRRLHTSERIALTGTPVENRLAELWSIMNFLNPDLLGSSEQFRTRFAIPVERHGQTEPAERLRKITRPYILRRLKTDPAIINDLPEKIEVKQYCRLTAEQASLYQAVVDDMMEKIEASEGIQRRGNVLATMTKLKQVCNHPAQLLHDRSAVGRRSGKVIRLEEILEELLDEGDKALCFTQFTDFAELLMPHLSARFGTDVLYLHGGTPKNRRDEMVTRFQTSDGPPIFLLSLKAGGTGLNLTEANHVIHLDRWWNPAVENQATDRAFRIGQKRNVQVRKFICTGTLEEKIDETIEQKKALADLVISDGEGWLTELSTGALRDLFALSEGAVDD